MLVHGTCVHMVHGKLELLDGDLWLYRLCRLGAPKVQLPCYLFFVTSGPRKKIRNDCWTQLMYALWIPKTSLVDVQQIEFVDEIHKIVTKWWKLTCSICKVPYGAYIQ